jgi:nucleotide-binding universal stress UspA family protein
MKTILVPLDGSQQAEQVIPYVRVLAALTGSRVQLLHVLTYEEEANIALNAIGSSYGGVNAAASRQERTQSALGDLRHNEEQYLVQHANQLRDAGITVDIDIQSGRAPDMIVARAKATEADLIAMATHGYTGLRRLAFGSVVDEVVHATSTPIFAVHARPQPAPEPIAIKRIVVPLDGSEFSRHALPMAAELARQAQAELIMLTVAAPPFEVAPENMSRFQHYDDALPLLEDMLLQELGAHRQLLEQQGVTVTPVARNGIPADTIVEHAKESRADLIVMATHGYRGIKRWALGSVADKVLHATATPILLVR